MVLVNYYNSGINPERKMELNDVLEKNYLNYIVDFRTLGFFIDLYGNIEGVYLYYALIMPRKLIEGILSKHNICKKMILMVMLN